MSLAAGNSTFAQQLPLRHTSSFSSECCSPPLFPSCSLRIAPSLRKRATAMAYLQRDGNPCARRVVLVMGFAVIRLLKMRAHAHAIDAIPAESTELTTPDQNQNIELSAQERSSGNPFFSILNVLGILGSGVLAALFASKKKEMATSDATIEYMKNTLKEKEAAIASLEKKFENELLNEKEIQNKALGKLKTEQQSLVNQLEMATDTITSLRQELLKEQKLVEELTIQVDNLEHCVQTARGEKSQLQQHLKEKLDCVGVLEERIGLLSLEIKDKEDTVWHLLSKLADKDRELNQLSSVYQQSKEHRTSLESEQKQLKDLLLENQEQLDLKNEIIHELDTELTTLLAAKDESHVKLDAISTEYNNFKSSTEKKSTSDENILGEREEKIHLLEEQLKILLEDKTKDEMLISALTRESDNLKEMLNIELKNMKILEEELRTTRFTLKELRNGIPNLGKELQQGTVFYWDLEEELLKVQAEFSEARESLQRKLDEAKQGALILAEELSSTKELLSKSSEELQIMSTNLAAALQKCSSLEEELIDSHTKSESATVSMEEEKNTISSLKKELRDLETQNLEEKDARKNLESDLEVATNYLNEVNQHAATLSKELKLAHSQISSLEDERNKLYNIIDEQKQTSQESQLNLEDAHNLIMRLGKERERLIKRGNKLEEELALAKGELLRLISRINSSKTAGSVQHVEQVDVEENVAASSRRNVQRRRKAKPQQQDS